MVLSDDKFNIKLNENQQILNHVNQSTYGLASGSDSEKLTHGTSCQLSLLSLPDIV